MPDSNKKDIIANPTLSLPCRPRRPPLRHSPTPPLPPPHTNQCPRPEAAAHPIQSGATVPTSTSDSLTGGWLVMPPDIVEGTVEFTFLTARPPGGGGRLKDLEPVSPCSNGRHNGSRGRRWSVAKQMRQNELPVSYHKVPLGEGGWLEEGLAAI